VLRRVYHMDGDVIVLSLVTEDLVVWLIVLVIYSFEVVWVSFGGSYLGWFIRLKLSGFLCRGWSSWKFPLISIKLKMLVDDMLCFPCWLSLRCCLIYLRMCSIDSSLWLMVLIIMSSFIQCW